DVVHDAVEVHDQVRGCDADQHARERAPAPHGDVMAIAGVRLDQGAIDVIRPDGGERAHIAGHARHEAGDQGGDAEAQESGAAVAGEHQGENLVVVVAAGRGGHVGGLEMKGQHRQGEQAGQDDDKRDQHLEAGADDGRELGRAQVAGGEQALDDQEVGGPVTERNHEAEAEDDAGPVDAHGVVAERAQGAPEMGVGTAGIVGYARVELAPAPDFDQAQDRDQQRARPDQHELQHLVEDRRAQAAERNIYADGDGGHPDAEVDIPTQHHLHDQRHGVHVDARDQHGHDGERDRRQRAARFAEAQLQIAGHGMSLRDVIERHHHQAEEDHGGDGADPVPMGGEDAVFVGGGGPAHQLERAEIGGEEAEAGDPGRHFAASEEEVFAGAGPALEVEADREH